MSSTILNDIVRDYESIAAAWFTALFPIAQAVFWVLVAIELVWSAIWWAIDREDGLTVVLNCVLLFIVVFYTYPMKFMFTRLISGTLMGIGPGIADGMSATSGRMLMAVYSSGFVALFTTFMLLHWNALRQRDKLALVQDPRSPCFTTPHFDGHDSVLVRASRLGEMDVDELRELIQDAWLSQASERRGEAWLAEHSG